MNFSMRKEQRIWQRMHYQGSLIQRHFFSPVQWSNLNLLKLVKASHARDPLLQGVIQRTIEFSKKYQLVDGYLRTKCKPDSDLRDKIFTQVRNSLTKGHVGRDAMRKIQDLFYQKGLTKDVRHHIRTCLIYQACKYGIATSTGHVEPLLIPI